MATLKENSQVIENLLEQKKQNLDSIFRMYRAHKSDRDNKKELDNPDWQVVKNIKAFVDEKVAQADKNNKFKDQKNELEKKK